MVIGLAQQLLQPYYSWPSFNHSLSTYRNLTPFVIATIGLLWLGRRRVISIGRSAQ
jgi:hypothetical protein